MAQYRATWRLENLLMVYCRIAALPKRHPDALHDEIMNFAALFEGGFTQRFINRLGQVDARMHDIRPWPSFGRLLRRLSGTRRGVSRCHRGCQEGQGYTDHREARSVGP